MRGYGGSSASTNIRGRNIATTNNSHGVISALTGAQPSSAKPRSAVMSSSGNGGGPNVGPYDPVLGNFYPNF